MSLAEFDGDFVNDLAIFDGDLHLLRNDDRVGGTWVEIDTVATGVTDGDLVTMDVDGMGSPDLVVVDGTQIRMYPVVGGVIQAPTVYANVATTPHPVAGDIDGDGDEDLVVFDDTTYTVLRRTGPSTFTQELPVVGGPATHLGDIDGDGDVDGLCCGGGGPSSVNNAGPSLYQISINDGNGGFAPASSMDGVGAHHLAGMADMDQDGNMDLVAGRCVYYGTGSSLPITPPDFGGNTLTPSGLFDFDGDGDPDVRPGLSSTFRNDGNGEFTSFDPIFPPAPSGFVFAGPGFPGDFDGDGDTDLVVSRFDLQSTFIGMRLLLNTGGGAYVDGGDAALPGVRMIADPTPLWPELCVAADYDNDGDQDLVIRGILATSTMTFWWNDGSGFFTKGTFTPGTRVLHAGDLDGDGILDLLVADDGTNSNDFLMVQHGLGGGNFTNPISFVPSCSITDYADFVDLADVDGDGDLDVACGDENGDLYVYFNKSTPGALNFPRTVVATDLLGRSNYDPRGVICVDVDNDGLRDLIAWNVGYYGENAPNSTYIFRRRFDNKGYHDPVMQVMQPSAYGDVDGDGDTDVISNRLFRNLAVDGPQGGVRKQSGAGVAGTAGITPVLGATGPFHAGGRMTRHVTGGLGGAIASFRLTVDATSVTYGAFVLGGTPGAAGEGRLDLATPLVPSLLGKTFELEALVIDPQAQGGISQSNVLSLTIGSERWSTSLTHIGGPLQR